MKLEVYRFELKEDLKLDEGKDGKVILPKGTKIFRGEVILEKIKEREIDYKQLDEISEMIKQVYNKNKKQNLA